MRRGLGTVSGKLAFRGGIRQRFGFGRLGVLASFREHSPLWRLWNLVSTFSNLGSHGRMCNRPRKKVVGEISESGFDMLEPGVVVELRQPWPMPYLQHPAVNIPDLTCNRQQPRLQHIAATRWTYEAGQAAPDIFSDHAYAFLTGFGGRWGFGRDKLVMRVRGFLICGPIARVGHDISGLDWCGGINCVHCI